MAQENTNLLLFKYSRTTEIQTPYFGKCELKMKEKKVTATERQRLYLHYIYVGHL